MARAEDAPLATALPELDELFVVSTARTLGPLFDEVKDLSAEMREPCLRLVGGALFRALASRWIDGGMHGAAAAIVDGLLQGMREQQAREADARSFLPCPGGRAGRRCAMRRAPPSRAALRPRSARAADRCPALEIGIPVPKREAREEVVHER
jgi:hypothetical protein